ncbi:MAG: septum formation initiator family protein [Bacteroidetes bacterium]|nr:septum formation initiator family protein [Bacteroidota bacterium]
MKKIFGFITNKYLLAIIGFGVWMFFFDQNDVMSMQQRKKELQDTKDNIAYLNKEIATMEKDKEDLSSNPQRLEQFAREQYHLKRDNEDVYIIDK